MEVTKIRGKEEIKVVMFPIEAKIANRLGVSTHDFVMITVANVAKKRRWKWWLDKHKEELKRYDPKPNQKVKD